MLHCPDNQFSRKRDFRTIMSISCNRIIWKRKDPFRLKVLGYFQDDEAYIWLKLWFEISLSARGYPNWILGFSKSENPKEISKFQKNPEIRNPPFPP